MSRLEEETVLANENLIKLWSSPDPEILTANWKIPPEVKIGLASGNAQKITAVKSILERYGSQLAASTATPENAISLLIKKRIFEGKARGILPVLGVAELKGLTAGFTDPTVTHVLSLDTDVVVTDGLTKVQLGKPDNFAQLAFILEAINDHLLTVSTACALFDVQAFGVLASDQVDITFKVKKFDINEFLLHYGIKTCAFTAGAIDYATVKGANYLDPVYPMHIARLMSFMEADAFTSFEIDPRLAPTVIGDYFHGHPPPLIQTVLYHGLTAKYARGVHL